MNNFDPKLKAVVCGHDFGNAWNIDDYVINAMFKLPTHAWTSRGLLRLINEVTTTLPSYIGEALERLEAKNIVVNYDNVSLGPSYKLTKDFIAFIGSDKRNENLLQVTILVKGNPVLLKHLIDFQQHAPWVLENCKEVVELFVGGVRLDPNEAVNLLKQLEDQNL